MIYLATNDGIVIVEMDGSDGQVLRRGLDGQHVTSAVSREGVILAGATDGVFRSDDDGRTWRQASAGLSHRHVRWMAFHPDISDFEFAGTEPAAIFISQDGANSWLECSEVAALRDQHKWFLPYSPQAGCVRGFAFHGARAYAAVEVGGVLRSDDRGESWALAAGSDGSPDLKGPPEPFIYPDLHSIHVHPSSPELVFAPTGGGFYSSTDGGATWRLLYDCYCRAVWIDPANAGHILLSPADGVERNGRIEESRDGGRTWRMASDGLSVPWPSHLVERFVQIGEDLLAVLSNGQVLSAHPPDLAWRQILAEVKGVNAAGPVG